MVRKILLATLIAGSLDLALATGLTLLRGQSVAAMLRFIASGPFPRMRNWGGVGAAAGIGVHFALMAIMATVYVFAWRNFDRVQRRPVASGVFYGLLTFVLLDLVILPLRFPAAWPPRPQFVATQLFAHVVLVGLLFSFIVARGSTGSFFKKKA